MSSLLISITGASDIKINPPPFSFFLSICLHIYFQWNVFIISSLFLYFTCPCPYIYIQSYGDSSWAWHVQTLCTLQLSTVTLQYRWLVHVSCCFQKILDETNICLCLWVIYGHNRIDVVMVSVLVSRVVYRGFELRSGQTKNYNMESTTLNKDKRDETIKTF